jgi:hypothetical protein
MEFRLHIGRKFTGIRVISDEKYPTMWRIHWADGEVSDMVNLTRAKDAASAGMTDRAVWKVCDEGQRGKRRVISRRVR